MIATSQTSFRDPATGILSDGVEGDLNTFEGRAILIDNQVNSEGDPSIFLSTTSSVENFVATRIRRIESFLEQTQTAQDANGFDSKFTAMVHIIK